MDMPNISIDELLRSRFPDIRVLWFTAKGLGMVSASCAVPQLIADVQAELVAKELTPEQVGQLPLLAPWRAAFSQQGIKPSQYRSSAEALVRRFAAGKYAGIGIDIVDAYNAISARFQVPIGAYDIAKLRGGLIKLRFGAAGDSFQPLGGNPKDYVITDKIPVYAIGSTVICWAFNHRDSRETSVDQHSDSILFASESIDRSQYENQDRAIDKLAQLLSHTGADLSNLKRMP